MTTFYLDYEGGNDSNDGTTFANRWKTFTLGATAARIAPGDIIRVMASPDQTSLGITGVWTDVPDGGLTPTKAIGSSTNATPIVVTITAHGYSNGDTLVITGHTTNLNANGTWEIANKTDNTFELVGSTGNGTGGGSGTARLRNNAVVKLASALTKNIASTGNRGDTPTTRPVWTASTNVTTSHSTTDFKDGDVSDSIDIAAGFTTGKAAYVALSASTDFSGYKQVSFWIKQTAGTVVVASDVKIVICSDTIGDTIVDTINVPALGALTRWVNITVNIGSALSSAAQSVAFYVNVDNGAQTFLLSNIIAVKDITSADSLSLSSLIGKNTAGETFYGIQSINGTRVMLDTETNALPTLTINKGYSGTTETVTTYKREPIKTVITSTSTEDVHVITDNGTLGNLISFEGGWNRTDMSTQTGESWYDGSHGFGDGVTLSPRSFVLINKISCVRYRIGLDMITDNNITITNGHYNNNTVSAINLSTAHNCIVTNIICNNSSNGSNATFQIATSNNNIITSVTCNNSTQHAFSFSGNNNLLIDSKVKNAFNTGINFASASDNIIINPTVEDCGNVALQFLTGSSGNLVFGGSSTFNFVGGVLMVRELNNVLRNFTINESTEVSGLTAWSDGKVYSEKHDGTLHNDKVFVDGGLISKVTDQLHGSSNYSWKFQPTSANRRSNYPIDLKVMQIACDANLQVTVNAWFRASHANLLGLLICKGKQIAGVDNDVTDTMTVAADTWVVRSRAI